MPMSEWIWLRQRGMTIDITSSLQFLFLSHFILKNSHWNSEKWLLGSQIYWRPKTKRSGQNHSFFMGENTSILLFILHRIQVYWVILTTQDILLLFVAESHTIVRTQTLVSRSRTQIIKVTKFWVADYGMQEEFTEYFAKAPHGIRTPVMLKLSLNSHGPFINLPMWGNTGNLKIQQEYKKAEF